MYDLKGRRSHMVFRYATMSTWGYCLEHLGYPVVRVCCDDSTLRVYMGHSSSVAVQFPPGRWCVAVEKGRSLMIGVLGSEDLIWRKFLVGYLGYGNLMRT